MDKFARAAVLSSAKLRKALNRVEQQLSSMLIHHVNITETGATTHSPEATVRILESRIIQMLDEIRPILGTNVEDPQ